MRKRSESFYTKSEDEFSKIIEKDNKRKRSKILNLDDEEETEELPKSFNYYDDMDELGVEKSFKLKKDAPTMIEDEANFIDSIAKINFSVKTKDKSQFIHHLSSVYGYLLKEENTKFEEVMLEPRDSRANSKVSQNQTRKIRSSTRSNTYSNLESLNINFDVIKSVDYTSLSLESTSNNSFNSIFINPVLKNNVNIVDDVMKLIVIGDLKVGKTFFINKFFQDENGQENNSISFSSSSREYAHTTSLEIKKKIVKFLGKNICLEVWDTNCEMLANEMCKVYFKICDGFILIVDPTKIETVLLIEKQIERILKVSSNSNFYLIANVTFSNLDFEKMKEIKMKFIETDLKIKQIVDKYDIKLQYINLENLKFFEHGLKKFLSLSYIKKGLNRVKMNLKKDKKIINFTKNDRRSLNYPFDHDTNIYK